jgi:hypothetical protein
MNITPLKKALASLALAAIGTMVFASAASAAPALSLTLNGSNVTTMASGDEIDVATGAPIAIQGTSSQAIGLSWSGQSLQLKDLASITQPEGWELQYSIDGVTWSTTAPSDLTTVVAVRSVGNITSKGGNTFQTSTTSTLVATQSNFQGSSGGDGYDLTFAGDRVFNIFHHNASQIQLDCHIKSTGASCFGAVKNFPGYATSNTSSSYWDAASSKLYAMSKKTATNEFGVACIDFANNMNPVLCSTPFYVLDDGVATTNAFEAGARSGDIVWFIDSSDYNLLCFNVATATACPDNQTQLPGTSTASTFARVSVSGTKVWYTTYDKFGCYDTVNNVNCDGNAPMSITPNKQYPPFPVRNASGTLQGYCLYLTQDCLDSNNTPFNMPAGLNTFVSGTSLPTWNYDGAGQWAENDNKLYLNKGPSATASTNVYCHDFDTDAACAGFSGANVGTQIYSIHKDPSIANCMWTNGNDGQITTFNATTGEPGCTLAFPMVQMPYDAVVPRMACDETGRVLQWDKINFTIPSTIPTSDIRVTVLDTAGEPVTGWVDRTITSDGVLDMSALSVSQTGTRPTIQVSAGTVDGALLDDITAVVKFHAGAPELCLTLKAAQVCPNVTPAQNDTSVPNGLIQATAVTTPVIGSPVGSQTRKTINGTNTGNLCASTIALLQTPTPSSLANTGGDFSGPLTAGIVLLLLGSLIAVSQRKKA